MFAGDGTVGPRGKGGGAGRGNAGAQPTVHIALKLLIESRDESAVAGPKRRAGCLCLSARGHGRGGAGGGLGRSEPA